MTMKGASAMPPYLVHKHDTVEAAMLMIEENRHRSVIVIDEQGVVVGTLSDGDIRKVMLDRRLLTIPVHQAMNPNCICLKLAEEYRAKEIFAREHIFLIPIVDDKGHLLKVLTAY